MYPSDIALTDVSWLDEHPISPWPAKRYLLIWMGLVTAFLVAFALWQVHSARAQLIEAKSSYDTTQTQVLNLAQTVAREALSLGCPNELDETAWRLMTEVTRGDIEQVHREYRQVTQALWNCGLRPDARYELAAYRFEAAWERYQQRQLDFAEISNRMRRLDQVLGWGLTK